MKRPTRQELLFSAIILVLILSVIEGGAFLLATTRENSFSHEAEAIANLESRKDDYERFVALAYDPEIGWRNPPDVSHTRTACGRTITYLNDGLGARRSLQAEAEPASAGMIAVGDSFIYGTDATYEEAAPSILSQLSGRNVANLGVPGYGPLQAVLRFEQAAPHYPNARIAVLGIMHENIRRMATTYRPLIFPAQSEVFFFKPAVDVRHDPLHLIPNPNGPTARPFDDLFPLVQTAFRTDFWAKPRLGFPYTVGLLRSALSDYVQKFIIGHKLLALGYGDLDLEYGDDRLTRGLDMVIARFVNDAEKAGMKPVIVFMPQRPTDIHSPDGFIASLRDHYGDRALIVGVGDSDFDWSLYQAKWHCHPTPAGNEMIGRAIYDALAGRGWLDGPRPGTD